MLLDPIDGSPLRQGDICRIDMYPVWKAKAEFNYNQHRVATSLALPPLQKVRVHDGGVLVAVCSQCCDLLRPGKTPGVLIAPVRDAPLANHEVDKRQALAAAVGPVGDKWSFVSTFPLMFGEDLRTDLMVVEFGLITSMSSAAEAVEVLLANRVYRLSDEGRDLFRTKLAASVGRPPSDEE